MTEAGWHRADEDAQWMMGLVTRQGQLDMVFDRFCRVPFSDALMDNQQSRTSTLSVSQFNRSPGRMNTWPGMTKA
jgi:hypothetical protein